MTNLPAIKQTLATRIAAFPILVYENGKTHPVCQLQSGWPQFQADRALLVAVEKLEEIATQWQIDETVTAQQALQTITAEWEK